jgi:hypothetical protein
MKILKVIETSVTISNYINFYSDKEVNINAILADRYLGKCFRGCFIDRIVRIIQMSECVIDQNDFLCPGNVNIIFEVAATVYRPGEIITGCRVTQKDPSTGIIIAETANAKIMVSNSKTLASVQVDQIIPLRVQTAIYNIGKTEISISAKPVILPIVSGAVYAFGTLDTSACDLLIADIRELLAEVRQGPAQQLWDFFNKLLYAYKAPTEPPRGGAPEISGPILAEISDQKSGMGQELVMAQGQAGPTVSAEVAPAEKVMWADDEDFSGDDTRDADSRDLAMGGAATPSHDILDTKFSAPYVCFHPATDLALGRLTVYDVPPPGEIIQVLEPEAAAVIYLQEYYGYLKLIKEMVDIYNTEKLINSHNNLWLAIKKSKTD